MNEICVVCGGKMPPWRIRDKNITCGKKCSGDWNHMSMSQREKLKNGLK